MTPREEDDRQPVGKTLYDIPHILESTDGAEERVLHVLELCRDFVPYDQCALLETAVGRDPRLVMVRPGTTRERAELTETLMKLLGRLVAEHVRDPDALEMLPGAHLAVPLIHDGEVIGVLLVARDRGSFNVRHLRSLTVVAANLSAYLTILRARANESQRAGELDQARRRLQHLYEISTVLTGFESVERTVPAVVAIIARTLPLHSAILILETAGRHRAISWQAKGESERWARAALDHARDAYEYLVGGAAIELDGDEAGPRALPASESSTDHDQRSFIMLPLVVEHRPIFGALQLEGVARLDERDLVFTNLVVNQLAIALDRQANIAAAQAAAEARRAAAEDRKAAAEERQEAAELREATTSAERNWLKAVLDQMPAGVIIREAPTWRPILANRRAHEMWQGSPPADWPLTRAVASGEAVVDQEVDFVRAEGTRCTLLVTSAPIRDHEGRIVSVVETFHDITVRKRVEQAQRFLSRASERLAQSLDPTEKLDAIADLVVPELADWCVVHATTETGGFEPLAVLHTDPAKVGLVREMLRRYPPAPGRDAVLHEVQVSARAQLIPVISDQMLEANAHDADHLQMLRSLAFKSAMVVPLFARGGVSGELLLASTGRQFDHADLELAEELARRAGTAIDNAQLYELTQRAIKARDDLLAMVSHDLKNPLHSVALGVDVLLKTLPAGKAADPARRVAARIGRAADRMTRLISDLLDVVSVEAGRLFIDNEQHRVVSLVHEAIESQQTLATAKRLALTADSRVAADLTVTCDRARVLQVFANLIGNAIKFTPEGGTITVRVEARGSHIRFGVTDTGPGIPEDALPHIFDRFWQAKQTARLGTGLGLSIASGIVKAHGGKIWVESRPGAGTTFYFTLPIVSTLAPHS